MTNYSDLWRRLSDGFGKNLAPPFRSPEIKVAFFVIAKSRNKKKKQKRKNKSTKTTSSNGNETLGQCFPITWALTACYVGICARSGTCIRQGTMATADYYDRGSRTSIECFDCE